MGAPVAAVRLFGGIFSRFAAKEGAQLVEGQVAKKVAEAAAGTAAKRSFGSYFTQIVPDAFSSVQSSALKDGVLNTIKANAADQFKNNMGGRWGILLPMAFSTAFGLKDAWTEAANDPNWLTKPFNFIKGLAWAAIPAAIGGTASLGYLSLFPKAKGIPSMLLQNMTYGIGEFMAKNVVGKPQPQMVNAPEVFAQAKEAQQLEQQQLAMAQQTQQQLLAMQQDYAQRLAQSMQPAAAPSAPASSAPASPLNLTGIPQPQAAQPFNFALPGSTPPLPQVNAALAQKLGMQPDQLAYLDQQMAASTGKTFSQMAEAQGITA